MARTTRHYGDHPHQFVELWPPTDGRPPTGAIRSAVLIHGGYWRDGYGLDLMDPLAGHLAGRGWSVVNSEYRRLPHADPVPAADGTQAPDDVGVWDAMAADVLSAIAIAAAVAEAGPVVVIGHSAGGHLALWAAARAPAGAVDAVVALAPVADLVEADARDLSGGVVRRLLGAGHSAAPERYRHASPIELVPVGVPQLVVHGDLDDSVPQEIAMAYVAAATLAGDDVDLIAPAGVDHFHVIDPTHVVWRDIDRWIDAAGSGDRVEG